MTDAAVTNSSASNSAANLNFDADDITAVLRKHMEGFKPSLERQQVGQIIEVGDGIARISGLPNTSVNELLEFEGGTLGLALILGAPRRASPEAMRAKPNMGSRAPAGKARPAFPRRRKHGFLGATRRAPLIPRTLFTPEHDLFREQTRRFVERERNWASNISRYAPVYRRLTGQA